MAVSATRTLYVCDNLPVLRGLHTDSVDLIATDPPFNAKRVFNAPLGSKAAGQRFDDRWCWDQVTDEWFDLIADEHRGVKEVIEAAAVIEGGDITLDGEIQAAACNIGLLLRHQTGVGTPRSLQGRRAISAICRLIGRFIDRWGRLTRAWGFKWAPTALVGSIAHRQAG